MLISNRNTFKVCNRLYKNTKFVNSESQYSCHHFYKYYNWNVCVALQTTGYDARWAPELIWVWQWKIPFPDRNWIPLIQFTASHFYWLQNLYHIAHLWDVCITVVCNACARTNIYKKRIQWNSIQVPMWASITCSICRATLSNGQSGQLPRAPWFQGPAPHECQYNVLKFCQTISEYLKNTYGDFLVHARASFK
jgi:hypothetical protein